MTTTASGIAKLPREVFVVDDEHVDAPAAELGQEFRTTHACGLGRALHRNVAVHAPGRHVGGAGATRGIGQDPPEGEDDAE